MQDRLGSRLFRLWSMDKKAGTIMIVVAISKLSDKRVAKVEDVVNIGDEVTVKVIEVDKMGRINLSMKPGDLAENK